MLGFGPIASSPIAALPEFGRTATLAVTEDDDTLESFILRYRFATITTSRPITADLITTTYN